MKPSFPETQLVEQIEDLLRIVDNDSQGPIRERTRDLLREVFEYARELLDIAFLLDVELRDQSANLPALRRAATLLSNAKRLPDIVEIYERAENPPSAWPSNLDRLLGELERGEVPQDTLSLFAAFRLALPKLYFDLQVVSDTDGDHIEALRDLVLTAMMRWSDDDLVLQHREAKSEFSDTGDWLVAFPQSNAPTSLFSASTIPAIRGALADYIVRGRPKLLQEWLRSGQSQWPDRAISLVTVLAEPAPDVLALAREPSAAELRAFGALLRVLSLGVQQYRDNDQQDFLAALRLTRGLSSIRTVARWIERWKKNQGAPILKLLLVELKGLVRDLGLLTARTPIEAVLRNYKLRNEVICRPPHPELAERDHEIDFQRHVCAYLLDNGIPSYGTKFGRIETDLILKTYPSDEEFVIEAKVLRSTKSLAAVRTAIQRAFAQLKKYMHDMPVPARGVLLLYSFAHVVIAEPREWIRRQYRIVVVDLAKATASKRDAGLIISEGEPGSGYEIRIEDLVGVPSASKKRGASSGSSRRRATR